MKYLNVIEASKEDLLDEVYNEITVPSVRFIYDTNEVVARKNQTDRIGDIINLIYLLSLVSTKFSGTTYGDYINMVYSGDVTSSYIKSLVGGKTADEFFEEVESLGMHDFLGLDFTDVDECLNALYTGFKNYDNIESSLSNFIAYKNDNDYTYNVVYLMSGSTESATTIANNLELMTEILDINGDGNVDKAELNILVQLKKFFPEYMTAAAYTSAKAILEDGEHTINDFVERLLGLEEFDATYDLNENGEIDEEDMCFFISAFIFGDNGITEAATTRRNAITKSNITRRSSNTGGSSRPPRGEYQGPGRYEIKESIHGSVYRDVWQTVTERVWLSDASDSNYKGGYVISNTRLGGTRTYKKKIYTATGEVDTQVSKVVHVTNCGKAPSVSYDEMEKAVLAAAGPAVMADSYAHGKGKQGVDYGPLRVSSCYSTSRDVSFLADNYSYSNTWHYNY